MSKWSIVVNGFENYDVINTETNNVVMEDICFHSIAENLVFQLTHDVITEENVIQPKLRKSTPNEN